MQENIFNRIEVTIKKRYYIYERYKSESTFALIYHPEALDVEELSKHVRVSDHFSKIDENHYFMVYTFTSHKDAFKASQNLLLALDKCFNNCTTSIAIDTFDTNKSAKVVLSRLMQILEETKKHSFSRIEDENVLDEIF